MLLKTRKQIAGLTSNILNPFLLSVVLIVLFSFVTTSGPFEALKWVLILTGLSLLPMYFILIYLLRKGKIDGLFTVVRKQRTRLYIIAGVVVVVDYFVLRYIEAPPELVAAAVAGFLAAVTFMFINLWWKISLHTAFISASVTCLIILYGWLAAIALVLVPLMLWSRVELKRHSPAQVIAGALLAALIIVLVFYIFLPWYKSV